MSRKILSKLSLGVALALLAAGCTHTKTSSNAGVSSRISDAEIRDAVNRVAHQQMRNRTLKDGEYPKVTSLAEARTATPPQGLTWSYPWGVTLYGLQRSVDVTGDKQVEAFVLEHDRIIARSFGWLMGLQSVAANNAEWRAFVTDRTNSVVRIRPLMSLGHLDSCGAMGVQFLESMLRHPGQVTEDHKAVAARIADWIVNRQQRLPDGTFSRPALGGTLWIDDLYMGCPYLVRWAKFTGDSKHLDDAARNVINMAARLQDKDGVWFHGYFFNENTNSPIKWGRGNGWAMVATVEVLSALPENHPDRPKLLSILRRHIEGIKKLQAPSGMWRQILDDPNLWEETSCTAMFTYSIARAVNRGWIDKSNMAVARKGFEGIAGNVNAEGEVANTCVGTNIGRDADYYINRGHPANDHHGPGVVLLAGTEILARK